MASDPYTVIQHAERISRLETEVVTMKELFLAHMEEGREMRKVTDEKLDELLSLRSKGVGAFWLASALLGTGILSFIKPLFQWITA